MSSGATQDPQVERRLRIAGKLIVRAYQAVQRAGHCNTLVAPSFPISATSDLIRLEEVRVMNIMTRGALRDLAKAQRILNSATSDPHSNTPKRSD